MKKIGLIFNTESIIDHFSRFLYDSPLAMLRENAQNAFDAVMERIQYNESGYEPQIHIDIETDRIVVSDNGIGMDDQILEKNYWAPGSSGKTSESAQKAGVVGHFGIGAMANFGVCKTLDVVTHNINSANSFHSFADRDKLNGENIIIEECEKVPIGKTTTAVLRETNSFSVEEACNYLKPFVQYVKVPIYLNGVLISQSSLDLNINSEYTIQGGAYSDGYMNFT